jgi:hypothetical protein
MTPAAAQTKIMPQTERIFSNRKKMVARDRQKGVLPVLRDKSQQ